MQQWPKPIRAPQAPVVPAQRAPEPRARPHLVGLKQLLRLPQLVAVGAGHVRVRSGGRGGGGRWRGGLACQGGREGRGPSVGAGQGVRVCGCACVCIVVLSWEVGFKGGGGDALMHTIVHTQTCTCTRIQVYTRTQTHTRTWCPGHDGRGAAMAPRHHLSMLLLLLLLLWLLLQVQALGGASERAAVRLRALGLHVCVYLICATSV